MAALQGSVGGLNIMVDNISAVSVDNDKMCFKTNNVHVM